ncbi:wolframin [Ischnura elegans]|uniref:wolframin n=1 Tax=Ischnura elegans TaxID=197161 RepID=UPI001ED895F5|nr:wolframin [Ischnura elegans]XP_046382537.1 wolframin [Ischnura elegans]XP_046382538.1 wolframin [Ischnura elegans]XP_046382539.1 wolframin [Ischnura elegans]
MAGIVPMPVKKSGRKQWTIHDGPKGSLRRLQSQMAEDGCPESQVVLAKKLLEEKCEMETEEEENARVAVYWLIKASEQGHDEGTSMLRNCLETGQGITEHNYLDVKTCLSMTQDEKLARRAARKLFSSLSAGQDFITTDQLRRRVESLDGNGIKVKKGSHRKKRDLSHSWGGSSSQCDDGHVDSNSTDVTREGESELPQADGAVDADGIDQYDRSGGDGKIDWVLRSEGYAGEKLTEEHLLSAASAYSRGQLPMVHRVLCLTAPHIRALHRLDSFRRSILHPRLCLALFHSRLLETLAGNGKGRSHGSSNLKSILRILPFFLIILAYTPTHSGAELFQSLWPLLLAVMHPLMPVLHYGALAVMVSASCRVCWQLSERRELRIWSRLLVAHVPELDPSEAEGRHARGDLHPWVQFFAALLVHVATASCVISGSSGSAGATDNSPSAESIIGNWQSFWPLFHSEVTVLSLSMMVIMLLAPPRSPFLSTSSPSPTSLASDPLSLICVALHVVSRYPYERDGVVLSWRLLDVRHPSEPLGRMAAAALRFCLASRTMLSLAVPVFLLFIAIRDARRAMSLSSRSSNRTSSNGIHRANPRQLNAAEVLVCSVERVVPLCMALAWWQVAMLAALGATSQGLLRAALATIGLLICVPLLGLSLLFLPVVTLAQQVHSAAEGASNWLMGPSAILAIVALPFWLLLPLHSRQGQQHTRLWNIVSRCVVVVQVLCVALAVVSLTSTYLVEPAPSSVGPFLPAASGPMKAPTPHDEDGLSSGVGHGEPLTWETYNQECHYPAWERTSKAAASLVCRHLVGTTVAWDGYVSTVKLSRSRSNPAATILSLLPVRLAAHLTCVIGEPTRAPFKGVARGPGLYNSGCHLESLAQEVVEVWVRVGSGRGVWGVASGGEVVLLPAEDNGRWSNFSLSLRVGDRVWFSGELAPGRLGDENPEVLVREVGCLACRSSHPGFSTLEKTSTVKTKLLSVGKALWGALSTFSTFLLGPIIL